MSPNRFPDIQESDLSIVPLEQSDTIPASWYVDPRFHELDRDVIFANTWQGIGHLSRLRRPGDQLVATIAENPVVVVKGDDGVLRAFYNVCRHRGGPIAMQDCNTRMLQCKYHGWTYRLDGSLRGTPRFDRTELFDKRDYGLVPVSLDVWEGLVFVRLDNGDAPVSTFFKGIKERIAPITITDKKFYRRIIYNVACNWKVYVDNYLEGYHLPYVHPELCNLLDYGNYVTETFDWYSLQHSPIQQKENLYGSSEGLAFYYYVWPNFMVNILPGRLQTNLVLPVTHNTCAVIFDYYYDDVVSDKARTIAEQDITYSDAIQQEDAEICGHAQKGLESRAYNKGRFSVECENGVYHFQTLLKRAYARAIQGGLAAGL